MSMDKEKNHHKQGLADAEQDMRTAKTSDQMVKAMNKKRFHSKALKNMDRKQLDKMEGKSFSDLRKEMDEKKLTPKEIKRAIASIKPPKKKPTLPKAPWEDEKKTNESFDFRVNVDGFPEMFMSGNSPGEVKTALRKLVKQPSMVKSVKRVTTHDKKKEYRAKMQEAKTAGKVDYGSDESVRMMKKITPNEAKDGDGVNIVKDKPFKGKPMKKEPDSGKGIKFSDMKKSKWAKDTDAKEGFMDTVKKGLNYIYKNDGGNKPSPKTNAKSKSGKQNSKPSPSLGKRINFPGFNEEKDPRLARAGVSGFNKAKRTPGHPTKSHIVVAKDGNKVKTIRFGQQGAKTAGDPKKGESDRMKKKRASFKARHGRNIAKGKMSAAYWADKEKW